MSKRVEIQGNICSCGSVVEHCINSARGHGFDSQKTHIMKINVLLH